VASINREKAWIIVTAVWKQNLKDDSRIHSADAYATALTDLTHSAGSARVAAILALVAVLFIVCVGGLHPTCSSKTWAIVVGLLLIVLHYWNYRRTGVLTERFINEVLSDALSKRKSLPPPPPVPDQPAPSSQPPTVTFVDL
jgi:hypothetical protein